MPREATITLEQVAAIVAALEAEGQKPTSRLILDRHGSGSLGTVQRLFREYKASRGQPVKSAMVLPAAMQRVILDTLAQEVASARVEMEAKLSETLMEASDLAAENEHQAARILELEQIIEALRKENATLAGQVAQLESDLVASRSETTQERQGAEEARTDLAKAQVRLEALPLLEDENERLRRALDAERTARTDAERAVAAAEAKAAGLADRLTDAQDQQGRAVATLEGQLHEHKERTGEVIAKLERDKERLEAALAESRKEAQNAAAQVGRLEGQIEALRQP